MLFFAVTGTAAITIDFNGWRPTDYAHCARVTGTDLKGPDGQTIFYFTGNWTVAAPANRPNDILTVPTVRNGTYDIDIFEGDSKDAAFTTDSNGNIATLTGNGAGTTFRKVGPQALEISWPYAKEKQTASAPANTTVTVVYKDDHGQP